MLEKLRLTSPKPGHVERVKTPLSPTPDAAAARFLKINVRHITDGQVCVVCLYPVSYTHLDVYKRQI